MNKNLIVGIAVAVIIIGGFFFYQKKQSAAGPLTIGLITGSSGQYAFVGENYIKAVNLAAEEWNASHPKDQVNIIVEDDAFDGKKGLAAYQKLTTINHISALINEDSPTIDSTYSLITQSGIPVAQGGEQGIEPRDDNVFQLLPGNIATEIALGQYVKDRGLKNITVFLDNNATFIRFFNGFKKGYGEVANQLLINPEERDYRSHVTKALATNPDAFLFLTTPEQGANLIKIMREQSKKRYQYIFDADVESGFTDYKKILGDTNILNGSIAVMILQHPNVDFAARYKAKYNEDPGIGADWAYDSFNLLMQTRAADWKTWVENMRHVSFEGAGGKVEFDDVGVRKPDFKIGTIENGKLPL